MSQDKASAGTARTNKREKNGNEVLRKRKGPQRKKENLSTKKRGGGKIWGGEPSSERLLLREKLGRGRSGRRSWKRVRKRWGRADCERPARAYNLGRVYSVKEKELNRRTDEGKPSLAVRSLAGGNSCRGSGKKGWRWKLFQSSLRDRTSLWLEKLREASRGKKSFFSRVRKRKSGWRETLEQANLESISLSLSGKEGKYWGVGWARGSQRPLARFLKEL